MQLPCTARGVLRVAVLRIGHPVWMDSGRRPSVEPSLSRFAWANGHADVWRLFDNGISFAHVVAGLIEPWQGNDISKVCGVEARGFVLGGAAAYALGVGFIAIRKQGNVFPGPKRQIEAGPDYRGKRHVL